ncbi:Protein DEHYDRATION-INDUCED 19-like protein 3 [Bienertia sinuspersici]
MLRKELQEGNLQSIFGGSSCIVSSSNAAPDPLLSSFILPMADGIATPQSQSSADTSLGNKSKKEIVQERLVCEIITLIDQRSRREGTEIRIRSWIAVVRHLRRHVVKMLCVVDLQESVIGEPVCSEYANVSTEWNNL